MVESIPAEQYERVKRWAEEYQIKLKIQERFGVSREKMEEFWLSVKRA